MCGRFTRTRTVNEYAEYFGAGRSDAAAPDFNVAPSDDVLAVVAEPDQSRHLVWLRWGLVPAWSSGPDNRYSMINARAETLAEKPAFRTAFRRRRCLVVADGFYEWRAVAGGKQPYYICLKSGAPMALAGIWDHWESPTGGESIHSAAIVTVTANADMAAVHERMPAILAPAQFGPWLDPFADSTETLQRWLTPCADGLLEVYPVSTRVNSPAHNGADLIEPL